VSTFGRDGVEAYGYMYLNGALDGVDISDNTTDEAFNPSSYPGPGWGIV